MRAAFATLVGLWLLAGAGQAWAEGGGDLRILTYPVGVVSGEVEVKVGLGAAGTPAELLLDGDRVCSPTAAKPSCIVGLGADPHVHLLELLRRDPDGNVTARASRWVNRPGAEAELDIRLDPRNERGVCYGHLLWFHPLEQDPVSLQVLENGRPLRLLDGRRSFGFPCPDPTVPHVLAASAVFPDGRRAEAVALSGGFGGEERAGLTAVPVVPDAAEPDPCAIVQSKLAARDVRTETSGFEVVFVLDPDAAYSPLYHSGWVYPSETGWRAIGKPESSWKRAQASLMGAEKLWLVAPDTQLHRVNGFARGKQRWLELLFQFGLKGMKTEPRLADAVTASGLVAAAGPRRRAVVLILGNHAARDASTYSPRQATAYLAELGVPLFVLRNGRRKDDGWGTGMAVHNMEGMREALETVRARLDQQCVAWFPGELAPGAVDALLPPGLHVAGRTGEAAASPQGNQTTGTSPAARDR